MNLEQIIKRKPLLIIGTGVHKYLCGNMSNAFSNWKTMLYEVRRKLKIVLPEQLTNNLPLVWELMVLEAAREGIKMNDSWRKSDLSASNHETSLRKAVADVLSNYPDVKEPVDFFSTFNPSAILSLNFDDKWAFGTLDRSYSTMPKNKTGILNSHYHHLFYRGINGNVPVYFPNGHVNHSEYLRLGYRDFGIQAEGLRKAFDWFKAWEKKAMQGQAGIKDIQQTLNEKLSDDNMKDQEYLVENKITWLNYFMLKPILIVGADISRHEVGLSWLIMQRERNYVRRGKNPGFYWVTTEKQNRKNELLEYEALGISVLSYQNWDTFWNEAKAGSNA
jgi:hypothetical protein